MRMLSQEAKRSVYEPAEKDNEVQVVGESKYPEVNAMLGKSQREWGERVCQDIRCLQRGERVR